MRRVSFARVSKRLTPPDIPAKIKALEGVYGTNALAQALGVHVFALRFKKHTTPVQRLVCLLHRVTFSPGQAVTVLDLLTGFKHQTTPQQVVTCGVQRDPVETITPQGVASGCTSAVEV